MIDTYGLTPSFILSKDFFTRDSRTLEFAEGVQAWFSWGKEIVSYETHKGKTYGFSFNGGRYPLRNVWYNDWNPTTNTGTHSSNTVDYHQSALKSDGTPAIRSIYEYGFKNSFEWLVNESWFDWREGSTWYRSNHSEYAWPNQYIALTREFADHQSESVLLEAEACDDFYDRSPGNSGGAYRVNWYNDLDKDFLLANMEIGLDIYRPFHQLGDIQNGGSLSPGLTSFSAGQHDVWGIDANGKIMCQEIDGHPVNWRKINNDLAKVRKLAVGRYYTWALTDDNKVMKAELPSGWSTNNCTGWSDVTSNHPMKDLDLSMNRVWAVDFEGKIFYRDLSGSKDWTAVPGKITSITADDEFVWGFTDKNKFVRMSTQSKTKWDTIPNPHNLIKIDAGATEVWGVNEKNEVYRINSSGDGDWQLVTTGYNNVSVGYEQVWLSDANGNMFRYALKGFEDLTAFARDTTNLFAVDARVIRNVEKLDIQVFPNPFNADLKISLQASEKNVAYINVYDVNGKQQLQHTFAVVVGNNSFVLNNAGELKAGVYILSVRIADKTKKIKLVKTN